MTSSRHDAFSGGVLAIAINIMVLEARMPHGGASTAALWSVAPVFVSFGRNRGPR
jgi:uncharacterized membrane protein